MDALAGIVLLTIALSVLVHGSSATPPMKAYRRTWWC